MKVYSETIIQNPLTKEPIRVNDGFLTLRTIANVCLNTPAPPDARNGRTARQVAELRMDILRKMQKPEAELLPEHCDELLDAVAAMQPPTIFEGVRDVFDEAKKDEADRVEKPEQAQTAAP